MAALAGYAVTLKCSGTPTTMTNAAMEEDPDLTNTWRVTDSTKRVLDPDTAVSVFDGVAELDPNDFEVNYLFGRVVLLNQPENAVSITAAYLPLLTVADSQRASLNLSRAELDTSVNGTEATSFILGQKMGSGELGGLRLLEETLDVAGDLPTWDALHDDETPKLLEVGLGARLWRGWVKFPSLQQEAPADGVVASTINFRNVVRSASGRSERVAYSFGAQ